MDDVLEEKKPDPEKQTPHGTPLEQHQPRQFNGGHFLYIFKGFIVDHGGEALV
jgi:hypothetical protein